MATPLFDDRAQAGYLLADRLEAAVKGKNGVILGLVRGGVAVARVLSDKLHLPMYPYVVRKIGYPGNPEIGIGAIAEGGETYLDESLIRAEHIDWKDLEPVIEQEMVEMKRRKSTYTVRPLPPLAGKTIILTDDGAATGVTMLAAIADVSKQGAERIIVALPVAPMETLGFLRQQADDVIVLENPFPFSSVGQWYRSFPQQSDVDVLALLQEEVQFRA